MGEPHAAENSQAALERMDQLELIKKQLDQEFAVLLSEHLPQLEVIAKFTESVASKLQKHYAAVFPKKCNTCKTVYLTREDYLAATSRLPITTTVYDEIGLHEYRNCACGSTLLVWTTDRRDTSEYGKVRRELFERCLGKLMQIGGKTEAELREKLRQIFIHLFA